MLADCPSLTRIVSAVLAEWPEHAAALSSSLSPHGPDGLRELDWLAADILAAHGDDLDRLARNYRWTCALFLEEELAFRRTGHYRCQSFRQIEAEVYSDQALMQRYMDGVLLSQVLWFNHARAFQLFLSHFLDGLPFGCRYLEVGPGHGLCLAHAARHPAPTSLTAWDVSDESLHRSAMMLDRLGILRPVTLLRHDLATSREEDAFDAVVLSEILEHLEDPASALASVRRLLCPGGWLWVNMPVNSPAPDHIALLRHPDEVSRLVTDAGFTLDWAEAVPMTGYSLERAIKAQATISCLLIARPRP